MDGTDNGDGTYTCTVSVQGEQNGYTAATAPIVMPVETPGYAAMAAPSGYVSGASAYTDAGFVYLYAGCRGRDAGAPAGVTALKAAVRFYRSVEELLPGDTERIFTFGMSGGGRAERADGRDRRQRAVRPLFAGHRRGGGVQRRDLRSHVLVSDHQPGHRRRRV